MLDATCPLVSKVHSQGKRYVGQGRTLILIGHAGHPEVEGTMGQVGGPTHLVSSEADVEALDIPEKTKVAYVTQTTLSIDDTRSIIAALHRKFARRRWPGHVGYLLCHAKPADRGAGALQDRGHRTSGRGQEQLELQPPARNRP